MDFVFSFGSIKLDGWYAAPFVLFFVGMFGYGCMSAVQDAIYWIKKGE